LDIELQGELGFDLLKEIDSTIQVVFVTAYDHYAIRAFEVNALDYLLKPVSRERFAETLDRLKHPAENKKKNLPLTNGDRIYVNTKDHFQFIRVDNIKVIQAQGDYSQIYYNGTRYHLVLKPLKEWEKQLPLTNFFRIHRSTIINMHHVERIEKCTSNTCLIYMAGLDEPFQMSQRNTAKFRELNLV
jgi:two-component system LytT family response regulator